MKKITIGFSKPKDKWFPVFSWAIRLYEGTPYSHVYIQWKTRWETDLCYHAASVSIHFLGESSFKKKISVVEAFEFEVSDEQFDRLMRFCTTYVGQDYAMRDVLMIPLSDLGIRYATDGAKKQYCAELVARAIGQIQGKELTQDADRVKLKEVYEFVKNAHNAGAL